MKFQLFGRLRDDEEAPQSGNDQTGLSGGSLERTVENMFQQGYSEDEIKDELQGQYSSAEVSRAVNNAVTSSATNDGGPQPMTPYQENTDGAVSPMDEGFDQDSNQGSNRSELETGSEPEFAQEGQEFNQGSKMENQEQQNVQRPQQGRQNIQNQGGQQDSRNNGTVDPAVEELIETIVAEQFQRVRNEFDSVYSELDVLIEEVESLEDRVHDLEIRDDEDQEQFIQKVDEMEDHIDSYQSRIGGLEKAFQQVLPSLVENVKELTSLVQEIKQEKGIETSTEISEKDVDDVDDIDMSSW